MIEELLHKYFEGETSAAEEKEIRDFFSSQEVPEHLLIYKPMFAYFDEEIAKRDTEPQTVDLSRPKQTSTRKVLFWVSGVAASVLILLGIGRLWIFPADIFCSGNYVVINGKCYTDKETIRFHAFEALQQVSDDEESFFPFDEEDTFDPEIIKDQLDELEDLFNDN